jgi:hypothetical protein
VPFPAMTIKYPEKSLIGLIAEFWQYRECILILFLEV